MVNIKSYNTWLKIVKPHKTIYFFQFITALVSSIINILISISSANLINNLSVFDYYGAIQNLIYILILICIEFLFWNINYFLYPKQLEFLYKKFNNNIFNKILSVSDQELKLNSKEKIMNILSSNFLSMVEFTNLITTKICYLITSIIMTYIIFSYSIILGLITLTICLITYVLFTTTNHLLYKRINKIQIAKDDLIENFSYIVDGRSLSSELNLVDKLKEKYDSSVYNLIKNYKKEHIIKLFSNKWIYFFWKVLVYITTFYLIFLVENYTFSLTIYLLLTPYISKTIENIFSFFSIFQDLSNAKISALRIKTILDMNEKDFINFGNNTTTNINGIISFTNVSFIPNENNNIFGKLNTFSMNINKNSLYFFEGKKGCGKRALFYLLRRKIQPTTGTITLDSINIYDFSTNIYLNNLTYTNNNPYFFNDSIINNLKYVNKNLKQIKQTLNFLNIDNLIEELPNKYKTNLLKERNNISSYLYFMIGLARCLLTNSEILCLYELPIGLSNEEINNISNILKTHKKNHTILFFSATDYFKKITDKKFTIVNGNISEVLIE